MNGKAIAKKLHEVQNGISGVMNHPEIKEMMNAFGYTDARMAEGQTLLDEAKRLMSLQVENYGGQYAATEQTSKEFEAAYADYMVVMKVIRVAFKGDLNALTGFRATGARSKSLSGWLREARIMYTNLLANAEALAVMARFGIQAERLQQELQQVNEVEALYSKQLEKKGEAQQSTVERDKALDALSNWYSDFRAIARIALYEKPQLLEALGIVKR